MPDNPSISQRAQGSYIAQATNNGAATVNVMLPHTPQQEQNRVRFLMRLRYQYYQIWKQSLQGAALLALGLNEQPDAVQHHTGLLFHAPQQPERPLPAGTTITHVFDEAGQELLILGEPGAGKSTLLLDLARHLVGRAEQDEQVPIPVIIPLSSWAVKHPPLIDWLREQLTLLYDVPRRLSAEWVRTNQILPLLDGLDEVPQGARVACIEAITAYRKEHLVPLVVCSRRTEYEEIERRQRLVLSGAVVIQPLSSEQILTFLDRAGPMLASVRTALRTNPVLRELITTPLMLSIVTLTYAGTSGNAIPSQGTLEEQQRVIFAAYVEHMVARKGDVARYPLQRTQMWLSWLARQMLDHHQIVFYLERLQPDWLSKRGKTLYRWSVGLVSGLIGGGLIGILIYYLLHYVPSFSDNALDSGLILGFLPGLLGGLCWGEKSHTRRRSADVFIWLEKEMRSMLVGGVVSTLVFASLHWDSDLAPQNFGLNNTISRLLISLVIAGVSGLLGGLIAELIWGNGAEMRIELAEVLTWSWKGLRSGLVRGLGRGLLLGLILGLDVGLTLILASALWYPQAFSKIMWVAAPILVIALGLSGMLLGMLFGTLFGGFSGRQLTEHLSLTPNDGLRRSAMHGLFVGLISAVAFALVSVPIFVLVSILNVVTLGQNWLTEIQGLQFITLAALAGGLLGMLIGGLAAVMRHYLLCFWLWQTRMFPWHTVRFLDDATSRILLRRIVGGYSFAHRLILDHFAFMDTTPTSSVFLLSSNPVPSLICSACGCQETRPGAKFCPRCGGMLA